MGLSPPMTRSPSSSGSEPEEVVLMSPPEMPAHDHDDAEETQVTSRGATDDTEFVGNDAPVEEDDDDSDTDEGTLSVLTVTRVVRAVAMTTMRLGPNTSDELEAPEESLLSSAEEVEPVEDYPVDTGSAREEEGPLAAMSTVSNDGSTNEDQVTGTHYNTDALRGSEGNSSEMSLSQRTLESVIEEGDDKGTGPDSPTTPPKPGVMEVNELDLGSASVGGVSSVEDATASDEEEIVIGSSMGDSDGSTAKSTENSAMPPSASTTTNASTNASHDQVDVSLIPVGNAKERSTPRSGKRKAQHSDKSPQTMTPRRSKRIKRVTPKSSPASSPSPKRKATKKAAFDIAERQFNIIEETDETVGSGNVQLWQCKHCGRAIKRRSATVHHLETCEMYQQRLGKEKELSTKMEIVDENASAATEAKALETLGSAVVDLTSSTGGGVSIKEDVAATLEPDQVSLVVWLFGSAENAEEMKAQYRRAPLVKLASVDRFRALINEQLFSLNVSKLLEHENDLNASLLVQGPSARFASEVKLDSSTRALEVYSLGFSIAVEAPASAVSLMASALSTDLGIGRHFGASEDHPGKLVFSRPGTALGWSFHRSESFVFILRGAALWKTKPSGLHHPLACLHSSPRSLIENALAIKENSLALNRDASRPALVPPFEHVFDDLEDDAEGLIETTVDAGAVVYMPGGTWYQAETEHDAVWLEIHVGSMTYEELVMSGLRTLLRRDEKWRDPVVLGSANDHGQAVRQKVGRLLDDLQTKIAGLKPNDLVPEFMVLGKSVDTMFSSEIGETTLTVDLRAEFSLGEVGKRLRLGGSSLFHVNALATLVRSDEFPCNGSMASEAGSPLHAKTGGSREHALQKKPKRACALRALSRRTDHYQYVLMSVLGADRASKAKLCVKFRCSATQAAMVEWVRAQEGHFSLDELKRGVEREHQAAGGPSDDAVKRVVRFLWCFGLLTAVKAGE